MHGGGRAPQPRDLLLRGAPPPPGVMELQRTASISGPLSPGYTGQVPYNYNQLEGRFKQLQGKPFSTPRTAPPRPGLPAPGVVLRLSWCHMVRDPNGDRWPRPARPGP